MIVSLTGSNSFAVRKRLNQMVAEFVNKYDELALERIDGDEVDVPVIIDAVQGLPFLSQRKMVVVRGLGSNKQAGEAIEQILSSVADSTDLIFSEPVTDKRTVYYKTLKSKTQLEDFNELDAHGLAKWLAEEAKKQAGELNLADANYLVERVGQNQELLFNELQKLLTYNPKIRRPSIDLLTEQAPQGKIFDLLDAAFAGDKKKALRLYEDQRAQQVEPQAIMAMVTWQLRLLTLVKLAKSRSAGQIAKDAGMNPYPVNKAAQLVKNLSEDKLRQMVDGAFNIDWRSKTSAIDLDEALKTYITTL